MKKTFIINLISGPGTGKTTTAAQIFAEMKMRRHNIEFVQEYAKYLVWTENYETLNNQYQVSYEQFKTFNALNNKVEFIVTDGTLFHGLVYNLTNPDNTSNIQKTENSILKWFNSFHNINIYLERDDEKPYEAEGRLQNNDEAKNLDNFLKDLLVKKEIPYTSFSIKNMDILKLCDFIETVRNSSLH